MIHHEQTISFDRAFAIKRDARIRQQRLADEYLESNHELFDMRDLQFYAEETGRGFAWVLEHYNGPQEQIQIFLLLNQEQ